MNQRHKKRFMILVGIVFIFSIFEIKTDYFSQKIRYFMAADKSLLLKLSFYPNDYESLCADGRSVFLLEATLYDSDHRPVPYVKINLDTIGFTAAVKPKNPITDGNGRVIISIYPDSLHEPTGGFPNESRIIPISIRLHAVKSQSATWSGYLTCPPVLLIHGFQDTAESMVPLKEYLLSKGFHVYTMDYPTESDMETMSEALDVALTNALADMKSKKIFTGAVDIISHSLGGLVTRYYTSNEKFITKPIVRKVIFINVPHHGTPWAEAGAKLLNSPYLAQLYPTSSLYTVTFPNAINKGLNHNLQVANIALENDEVVPLPSAKLSSWNIPTKIYRIGSESLDLESVIHSQTSGGSRHHQILFYVPVFEEILHFLTEDQPYPQKSNKRFSPDRLKN